MNCPRTVKHLEERIQKCLEEAGHMRRDKESMNDRNLDVSHRVVSIEAEIRDMNSLSPS